MDSTFGNLYVNAALYWSQWEMTDFIRKVLEDLYIGY